MPRKPFSDSLVDDARVVFQRRIARQLTRAEAAQMLEELTGFFLCLHKAELDQRRRGATEPSKGGGRADA